MATTRSSGNGPSRIVLIAAAVLAATAIGICNTLVQRLDPKVQEQMEKDAAAKAAADAAKKATPSPSPSATPGAASAAASPAKAGAKTANDLVTFGETGSFGNPKATKQIVIRWHWTPAVQADPAKVWEGVEAALKYAPDAHLTLENDDENPEAPASGVYENGNLLVPAGADGSLPPLAVGETVKTH